MAHSNEVPDELKDPDHVVPSSVWEQIRIDAKNDAKAASEDGR